MSKVQVKVYSEMQGELAARKRVLEAEKAQLAKATGRIAEIDEELSVIASEESEYVAAIGKLTPTVEDVKK